MPAAPVVVRRGREVRLHVLLVADVEVVKVVNLLLAEDFVVEVEVLERSGGGVLLPPEALFSAAAQRRVHVRVAHDVARAARRHLIQGSRSAYILANFPIFSAPCISQTLHTGSSSTKSREFRHKCQFSNMQLGWELTLTL